MLYGTGIRIGEALRLLNRDVNLDQQHLTLKATKNTKDRYVPFDNSLANVCSDYLNHRNALPVDHINDPEKPFFTALNGGTFHKTIVGKWFRRILIEAKIPINSNGKGPRIHDIRHTMACHSFVKLARDGMDMYCSWPYLSAYLGHQSLRATEQYIRLSEQIYPELLKGSESLYIDILPDLTTIKQDKR
jgi:integrase